MSKVEQLKRLRAEIAGDAALVEKLRAYKSPNELAEQVTVIARERGYDVTAADILAVLTGKADGTDLTEEELAAVSGGTSESSTRWMSTEFGCPGEYYPCY